MTAAGTLPLMDTARDTYLDRLALGSRCHRCGAWADEPCRTPSGRETVPHAARIDRAVALFRTGTAD